MYQLVELNAADRDEAEIRALFRFCRSMEPEVPCWFETPYELWTQSLFRDTDYEAEPMFRELHTWAAMEGEEAVGFVQFGIPNYLFAGNGEKQYGHEAGIVRSLYARPACDGCAAALLELAEQFFRQRQLQQTFAFFHAFGMTCYACHGKLPASQTQVEKVLRAAGYRKEHENVYYKKNLTGAKAPAEPALTIRYGDCNTKGLCCFTVEKDGIAVAAGELVFLPQGGVAYLKWIAVASNCRRKGYGAQTLALLSEQLYRRGIRRLDTDTADSNLVAQSLYERTGFENMGRTRSYLR